MAHKRVAPGYGDRRKALLQDMAILTGGQVISGETGVRMEHFQLTQLGRAARVVVDKDTTTIIGGMGDPAAIDEEGPSRGRARGLITTRRPSRTRMPTWQRARPAARRTGAPP